MNTKLKNIARQQHTKKLRARKRNRNNSKITTGHQNKYESDRTFVWLLFTDPNPRTNIGFNNMSWRYRANGAYDPDPAVLSGALTGFAEYAALYGQYFIHKVKYNIELINRETTGITAGVFFSRNDLGLNAARSILVSKTEQPYCNSKLVDIADSGADLVAFHGSMAGNKIIGDKIYSIDPNYRSDVTSIPAKDWYLNVFAFCNNNSSNFTSYLDVKVTVSFLCEFYYGNDTPSDSFTLVANYDILRDRPLYIFSYYREVIEELTHKLSLADDDNTKLKTQLFEFRALMGSVSK